MPEYSTGIVSSRRMFLKAGTATAALVTAGTLPARASAPGAENASVSVKAHGAVGDGQADDTDAFQQAIAHARDQRLGTVYVPAGTFMLDDTLRLPSDLALVGAGRGLTTLKAIKGSLFSKFKLDPRAHDVRQRRTLITTEAVGTRRREITRHVTVAHMTIDWNHCPTGGYGHSVLLMDSCDRAFLHDLDLVNCIPSDHPTETEQIREIGHGFRCECVMYANARYGLMDHCSLTDAGYRPLSVSYGSRKITFQNGIIHAENPIRRHVFAENHGDGLPRDDTFVHSEMIFLNSTFILERGRGGFDGIASHTGTTHVENCDFYIARDAADHFRILLKPFDGARNCTYLNNRFHLDEQYTSQFSVLATDSGAPIEAITFAGNMIDASYGDEIAERWRILVRFASSDEPHRRIVVRDNLFNLSWRGSGAAPGSVIQVRRAESFLVANNIIEMHGSAESELPTTAIAVQGARRGQVLGNCGKAVDVDEDSSEILVEANLWTDADRQ